jgi:deoxyribodipyrimidine photo-lyase
MYMREQLINANDVVKGKCVLYVMSRDQRVHDNHALAFAQDLALKQQVPMAVVFCLKPNIKNRSREQYTWMIDGLKEVEARLQTHHIPFMMLIGSPDKTLPSLIHHTNPSTVVFDMNPLKGPRKLQNRIAQQSTFQVYVVDTHNIVPIWEVSNKQEYAARTIRSKIQKLLPKYLEEPKQINKHPYAWPGVVKQLEDLKSMIDGVLRAIPSNGQKLQYIPGEDAARSTLDAFIQNKLLNYALNRNDPSRSSQSDLSPYLHFGHISRLRITLDVLHAVTGDDTLQADSDVFLEELNVRSSLSDNFCYYNDNYDSLLGAADWAQKTLQDHAHDPREFVYSFAQFESADTHDDAWNASQVQLLRTGKMHGYMRMYWAKKVLEWSKSPEDAHNILVRLNDFYSLDGGDPNGYVGILWSIAGLHDRPWFKRPIYGTIRYMNYNGLKRKFKIDSYIEQYHV